MRAKILLLFLVCAIFISVSGVGHTQVIAPKPALISSQLPMEILAGLIGKYIAMMQQYEYLISQGQNPESAISMRVAGSIDISALGVDVGEIVDPTLLDISKMVFWINANIFAKQPSSVAVDLGGSFGNVKILNTDKGAILASYDEGIYSVLPMSYFTNIISDQLPIGVGTDVPMSTEELQQLTLLVLAELVNLDIQYEGLMPTPRGIAHVVKLEPMEGIILTLWVLDRTWDLCKIEFVDVQDGIMGTVDIDKIELVSVVPGSEFEIDMSALSEIDYESMILILGLKVASVAFSGVPVVSDLYVTSAKMLQGQKVKIISNAFDSEDEESELIPLLEYKTADGVWMPLEMSYVGTSPLGRWQAEFSISLDEMPGIYDFRVSYTDRFGNTSEAYDLPNAVEVVAVPPRVVNTVPSNGDLNVPASSSVAITFNQKMNEESVKTSFSMTDSSGNSIEGSFGWMDNSITFTPSQELSYSRVYTVKILGSAMGSNGASLDANGDGIASGSPQDDFVVRFTVEAYPTIAATLVRPGKDILKGDLFVVKIMAESMSDLISFALEVKFDPTILQVYKVDRATFSEWRPRPKFIGEHDLWAPVMIDNENGKITLVVNKTRDVGISGTGALATIAFNAIGVGDSTIGFENTLITSIPETTMQPALRDAKVGVRNFRLYDLNKDGIVNILDFVEMKPNGDADVNGDGVVDVLDIVAAMNSGRDLGIWDANGDGVVDIKDFIIISANDGNDPDANGDGVIDILDIVYLLNGAKASPMQPLVNSLGVSYPNPCNPEAWIPFKLAEGSDVAVKIFSSSGQLVKEIDLGYRNPGNYITRSSAVYWDGMNKYGEKVPSGIYFYNIKAGSFTATKKMIVLK